MMNLDELALKMKGSLASLFYGSGVAIPCGGPSWDELFSALRSKFPGGSSDDFFIYMQEIIGYDNSNRAEVEDFIRERLASISPQTDQKYLFSIPWRAVLTTNYDQLPESVNATIDGRRQIMTIADPKQQIKQGREDHLYCFKLLGDCQYSFAEGGWMVLSTSDLFSAAERRTRFFQQFRNLATSGHIVYLGYSFKDDLVFLLLSHMKTVVRRFPWKGFAVTPSEPSPDVKKKLESVGITWVRGTLRDFIEASKKVFGERPSSAPTYVGALTIHRQTIELDRSTLSNIWKKFSLLHDGILRSPSERPVDFLRGKCESFHPYVFNWDFPRKTRIFWSNPETEAPIPENLKIFIERADSEELSDNIFVALVGIAGSGKTVVADRLAFDWYQTGNPVIFIEPESLSIDINALDGLMSEIREKYTAKAHEAGVESPLPLRWLIVADDCGPLLSELKNLKNHLMSVAKPSDMIVVTRETETPIDRLKSLGLDVIYRLDDTVLPEEREEFLEHFKRFGLMDEDIVRKNFEDEEINASFFALLYSSVEHSRLTIRRLLEDEYSKLDVESKRTYRIASLIQSYRLKPLVSLVLKSDNTNPDWLDFQVKRGVLGGVLRFSDYGFSLLTPNRVIAEAIANFSFRTSEERKLTLSKIISAVTFGDLTEMQLLENLLNRRIELDIGPRLLMDHKLDLFRRAVQIVRSRPLLIHLGRLETNAKRFLEARKTFRDAHNAYIEGFDERVQHVLDAEGRLEFALAEQEISAGNHDSAWESLQRAEEKFVQAQMNPRLTPHPYEGLGRTYLAKARISKKKGIRWEFILAAMAQCNRVEKYLGESSEIALLKSEVENMLDRIGFDETHIEKIGNRIGKANGYAYLAETKISRGRLTNALKLVEQGLNFDGNSIWLMRLRVHLLRRLSPDNHDAIMKALDDYWSISHENYDIELSFELAKEIYMLGRIGEAKAMFRRLFSNARHHPRRYIPRDPLDRWIEKGAPVRLTGTISQAPTEERYGYVRTTFPTTHRDSVAVRFRDIRFENPRKGDRVSYEIIFNMRGPEASKVRES